MNDIIKHLFVILRNPEVSGFYRLFATCLRGAEKTKYFSDDDSEDKKTSSSSFRSFSSFVRDSLRRCRSFEDELLLSCLTMCLEVPPSLAREAGMSAYAPPLERVFRRYGGRNLTLVNR